MDIKNIILRLAEQTMSDVVYEYGNHHRMHGNCEDMPIVVMSSEMSDILYTHRAIEDKAESEGIEFVHYDEYYVDHDAGKAWRTEPDSYFWQPSVVVTENGIMTPDDDIDEWIDWAVNDPTRCITPNMVKLDDLLELGFDWYPDDDERYESGLHEGMNDDPRKLYDAFREEHPNSQVIFWLAESSQFYVTFKMLVRPERTTVSSNGFSHDLQVQDALDWLEHNHNGEWETLIRRLPETQRLVWEGSWVDCEATRCDPDFMSWVADALEDTGLIEWEDGEPYAILV